MARWVAIFVDDPHSLKVREDHHGEHFDYLAQHREKISIAGGLRPAPDMPQSGGLWVMEVESRGEAVWLCENDPYFKLGLRKGYRLFVWGKAPVYGEVGL